MEYLLAIIILGFFGIACGIKANRKGLSVWAWFIIGLFFGPLGWVLVTLQRDRREAQRRFEAEVAALRTAEGVEQVKTMMEADRPQPPEEPRDRVGF